VKLRNKLQLFVLLIILANPALAVNRALLIGISNYLDNSSIQGQQTIDLEGPRNDVNSFQNVLIEQWGFEAKNVWTLIDTQASKQAILKNMQRLAEISTSDDNVVIYFSGHGVKEKTITPSGMQFKTGVLIPADFKRSTNKKDNALGLIIGRRDYRNSVLAKLDQKAVHTWFIVDACFSGNAYRALLVDPIGKERSSFVDYESNELDQKNARFDFPYDNVVFLSASSFAQTAWDIGKRELAKYPTIDNKPHGAFSNALLKVMSKGPVLNSKGQTARSYRDMYHVVRRSLKRQKFRQDPQLQPSLFVSSDSVVNKPVLRTGAVKNQNIRLYRKKWNKIGIKTSNVDLNQAIEDNALLKINTKDPNYWIVERQQRWLIVDAAGQTLSSFKVNDVDGIIESLSQYVWANTLASSHKRLGPGISAGFSNPTLGRLFLQGIHENYTIQSDMPAYISVLNVTPMGEVNILYPVTEKEARKNPARQVINFPLFVESGSELGAEILISLAIEDPEKSWFSFFSYIRGMNRLQPGSIELSNFKKMLSQQSNMSVYIHEVFSIRH